LLQLKFSLGVQIGAWSFIKATCLFPNCVKKSDEIIARGTKEIQEIEHEGL
jgi:hypothetical protein